MADTIERDDFGWWVCACVKGGSVKKRRPSTHIKMHPPTTNRCRVCGVTRQQSEGSGRWNYHRPPSR